MATEADILRSLTERLRGWPIPDDLRALVALQVEAGPDGYPPNHPLGRTETWILGPGERHDIFTEDLTDEDRADPELMANVTAVDAVFTHCAWVAGICNGDVAGYWLHPDEPADQPPLIVAYDTEAQFQILAGQTLVEALIYNMTAASDDDEFADLAGTFAAYGLPISASRADDIPYRPAVTDPAALHERYYWEERAARGLPSTP